MAEMYVVGTLDLKVAEATAALSIAKSIITIIIICTQLSSLLSGAEDRVAAQPQRPCFALLMRAAAKIGDRSIKTATRQVCIHFPIRFQ